MTFSKFAVIATAESTHVVNEEQREFRTTSDHRTANILNSGKARAQLAGLSWLYTVTADKDGNARDALAAGLQVNKSWCGIYPIHKAAYNLNFGTLLRLSRTLCSSEFSVTGP